MCLDSSMNISNDSSMSLSNLVTELSDLRDMVEQKEAPPTAAQKKLMKWVKKLREIRKLEELLAAGTPIDPLQQIKLRKREEIARLAASARQMVLEERRQEFEQPQVQPSCPAAAGPGTAPAAGEAASTALAAGPGTAPAAGPPRRRPRRAEAKGDWWPVGGTTAHDTPAAKSEGDWWPVGGTTAHDTPAAKSEAVPAPKFEPEAGWWPVASLQFGKATLTPLAQGPKAMESSESQVKAAPTPNRRIASAAANSGGGGAGDNGAQSRWAHGTNPSMLSYTSLQDALQAGGEERTRAVMALRGTVWPRSLDAVGCWDVQKAMELLDSRTASELVLELHGHVREAVSSPHANYVLQKLIVVMTPLQSAFIVQELFAVVGEVARHRFGCRILCRLLEHFTGDSALTSMVDKLLVKPGELCSHPFAHHVMESVLEHGSPQHKRAVCGALIGAARRIAASRHGSFVVEAALINACPEDVQALAMALVRAGAESLGSIAHTPFGAHVVRALTNVPGEPSQLARRLIESQAGKLSKNRHGLQLLRDLGLQQRSRRGEGVGHGAGAASSSSSSN